MRLERIDNPRSDPTFAETHLNSASNTESSENPLYRTVAGTTPTVLHHERVPDHRDRVPLEHLGEEDWPCLDFGFTLQPWEQM
jgi:hypothetical protein